MTDAKAETGLLTALMERFERQILPRARDIKKKVDDGEPLDDGDITFLDSALKDTRQSGTLLEEHPEVQDIAARMIQLYHEITEKALQNERDAGDD